MQRKYPTYYEGLGIELLIKSGPLLFQHISSMLSTIVRAFKVLPFCAIPAKAGSQREIGDQVSLILLRRQYHER